MIEIGAVFVTAGLAGQHSFDYGSGDLTGWTGTATLYDAFDGRKKFAVTATGGLAGQVSFAWSVDQSETLMTRKRIGFFHVANAQIDLSNGAGSEVFQGTVMVAGPAGIAE